jgi:uncharacterized SAM-binding protein YcdF (DUF218 family)/glycosyltransferase involved in cell wall biosynthesis
MLHGRDVICISSIDWDFIWQGHQQIMATLAAHGNRVLFIENTGVRAPRLSDLPRLRHRIANWWRSTRGFRQERPNLFVFSPLVVPLPYSLVARWINRLLMVGAIRRWMKVMRFGRPIIWTFLPTPLARDLIVALEPQLTVYYCIDDFLSSSAQARRIERNEQQLLAEADLVLVTSVKLAERARRFRSQVELSPFAVDYAKFEAARLDGAAAPSDVAGLPRPVVGYVGGIHQWVDQALLVETARRMPEASFVLVGPVQTDVTALAACGNIHLLGARRHDEVPRYLRSFDVALVPYRRAEYTAHVYPTKLNEYLAMGKPVVATDLAEIRRFNAEHGDVISVADTSEEFTGAVRAALVPAAAEEVRRRIDVARANSWDARIERMCRLVEEELRRRGEGPAVGWEERLRRIYRGQRARLAAVAGVALVVYGALVWSPLPWIVAEPLRLALAPSPADAIVVFAGGVGETGRGGEGYQDRVQHAVGLYRAGFARYLIFSTGWTYTFHEAQIMRAVAVALGVPADAILLEEEAGSTFENVVFVRAILDRQGWRRVLLVSSPYHMRRAVLTFRKTAPHIDVVPAPARSAFYAHDWGATPQQLRAILHEYLALVYYAWQGWI